MQSIEVKRTLRQEEMSLLENSRRFCLVRNHAYWWWNGKLPSFFNSAPAAAASMLPASESGQSYLTIWYCIIRSAHDCFAQKTRISMETGDSLSENWNAVAFMLISIALVDGCRHWPISFTCSDTYHPVNLFSLFHEDSPCLTSTKVYLLRLDVSLLIAHATALLSLNPDLLRNILSDYAGDRSTMIATFLLLHQSFRIPCILMARSSTDIEIFEIWYHIVKIVWWQVKMKKDFIFCNSVKTDQKTQVLLFFSWRTWTFRPVSHGILKNLPIYFWRLVTVLKLNRTGRMQMRKSWGIIPTISISDQRGHEYSKLLA